LFINSEENSKKLIYLLGIFFSTLLTAWMIHLFPVFDVDGRIYLQGAYVFLKSGIKESFLIYPWPFYQILVAYCSKFTHLSLLNSAHLLNFIFSAATITIFLNLLAELGASKKTLWLALITFLLFHCYYYNSTHILRDLGYWTFYLLSILSLLKFLKFNQWRFALLWSVSIYAATAFRIDGIIFLAFMPFSVWFFTEYKCAQKTAAFLKLNLFTIIISFFALSVFLIYKKDFFHFSRIGEFTTFISNPIIILQNNITGNILALQKYVLGTPGASGAGAFLFFGMLGVYFCEIAGILSVVYMFLCGFAWYYRAMPANITQKNVLWAYAILNVFMTIVFYLQNMFLATRYLMGLVLVLLCYVPFGLEKLYYQYRHNVRHKFSLFKILFFLVCAYFFANFVGEIHNFGHNRNYIYNASMWLRDNTNNNVKIFSNDARILWLSNRLASIPLHASKGKDVSLATKILEQPWQGYDYFVVALEQQDVEAFLRKMQNYNLQLIKVFSGSKGAVLIFKPRAD